MGTDYGYANARVRAMKSCLFRRPFYEKLLQMATLQDMTTTLAKTPYSRDIDDAMIKYSGIRGFDEALRMNTMRTFRKILKFVDSDGRELVDILVGRWDVSNIKTILRGRNIGASTEDIVTSLIPAGELDEITLRELAGQLDVRSCIDLMATWRLPYASALTEAFPEYTKRRNLTSLELALDKTYYADAFKRLRRNSMNVSLVREILRREIDLTNIMTVLRLIKDEINAKEATRFLLEGGKEFDIAALGSLLKEASIEDVVFKLKKTSYGQVLESHMNDYFETGSLVRIERSLEETAVRRGISMFRADPLSIAIIIGYIWAKYNEIINLRVIARSKMVGMPEDKTREALILA